MKRVNPNRNALLALAILVVVWGYSWIVIKQVTPYIGPFDFVALRFGLATVVLLAVLLVRRESLKPTPLAYTIAVGATQTAAMQALSQWALVSGGAGHVSILAYTMPFWSVLFAWWLLRERPNPHQWFGIVLAVGGLICILEPWHGLGGWQSSALAIAAGASWALGIILAKRMFERYHPPLLAFTFWQLLFGSIFLAATALLTPSKPIQWTSGLVWGLLYAAVPASAFAWALWSFVIDRLPATIASLSSLGVPISAILLAWIILGERPDRFELLGVVLIVLGLVAISGIGRRPGAKFTPRQA
jgi:drug/metabolite transporter (DMT)-like permease